MQDLDIVQILNQINGLRIVCPNSECGESFTPKEAKLFDIRKPYPRYFHNVLAIQAQRTAKELKSVQKEIERTKDKIQNLKEKKNKLKKRKITRPKEIKVITRRINIGQIVEKILPATNKFYFQTNDCRTLFTPIDYIAFNGLVEKGEIYKVSFIEVKTGNASLQKVQRQVKDAIESENMEVRTY
jgi:predicted Holliday junction resolvase-like endonuclease